MTPLIQAITLFCCSLAFAALATHSAFEAVDCRRHNRSDVVPCIALALAFACLSFIAAADTLIVVSKAFCH